ncbi:hypothetical protein FNF28_00084 [Cafeteria roenbergensis]|uniref:SET domain-containing protein n=2 Tax=Cafeteria roenbergensis TaxID=33653 RepID=A0A5A8E978_CAFRO|nr:hypothetical protein FNF28_00084 [Cafeteria roenbergensis]
MPAAEARLLAEITESDAGASAVRVGISPAVHGRGLFSTKDISEGETIVRQKWPLASKQDLANSWRADCCQVCCCFLGTIESQLRTLTSATADADTWQTVAASFPMFAAAVAAGLDREGALQPDEDDELPTADICLLDDGRGRAIPTWLVSEEDQLIASDGQEVGGVVVCSASCAKRAQQLCLPVLEPEGQSWFASLLRRMADEATAKAGIAPGRVTDDAPACCKATAASAAATTDDAPACCKATAASAAATTDDAPACCKATAASAAATTDDAPACCKATAASAAATTDDAPACCKATAASAAATKDDAPACCKATAASAAATTDDAPACCKATAASAAAAAESPIVAAAAAMGEAGVAAIAEALREEALVASSFSCPLIEIEAEPDSDDDQDTASMSHAQRVAAAAASAAAATAASFGSAPGSVGSDDDGRVPGAAELASALAEHAREHSESFALAMRVYSWALGELLNGPPGQTLPRVLRRVTLLSSGEWWDVVRARTEAEVAAAKEAPAPGAAGAAAAAAAAGADIDDAESDATSDAEAAPATREMLVHTAQEALVMLRAVLEPRFRAVCHMRATLGLEAPPAGSALAAETEEEADAWARRAADRGWGLVAGELRRCESILPPGSPGGGSAGGLPAELAAGGDLAAAGTPSSTVWDARRWPSGAALDILFSEPMFARVLGLFELNCIGVSIASPVSHCVMQVASSAAKEAADSGSAAASHPAADGAPATASAVWDRVRSALVAASLARRLEGADEPDAVARAARASSVAYLKPSERDAAAAAGLDDPTSVLVSQLCPHLQASALFPVVAMTNHSHTPNADFVYPEGTVSVRLLATRDVSEGEEVRISYCDETLGPEAREAALRHYGIPA